MEVWKIMERWEPPKHKFLALGSFFARCVRSQDVLQPWHCRSLKPWNRLFWKCPGKKRATDGTAFFSFTAIGCNWSNWLLFLDFTFLIWPLSNAKRERLAPLDPALYCFKYELKDMIFWNMLNAVTCVYSHVSYNTMYVYIYINIIKYWYIILIIIMYVDFLASVSIEIVAAKNILYTSNMYACQLLVWTDSADTELHALACSGLCQGELPKRWAWTLLFRMLLLCVSNRFTSLQPSLRWALHWWPCWLSNLWCALSCPWQNSHFGVDLGGARSIECEVAVRMQYGVNLKNQWEGQRGISMLFWWWHHWTHRVVFLHVFLTDIYSKAKPSWILGSGAPSRACGQLADQ